VNLKLRMCSLLSLLRIHQPDCEHCNAGQTCGEQMRKRLEELGWRTQPHSPDNGEHGAEVSDSKPGEVVAGASRSLGSQKHKVA
jgi:hypothetical protein